MLGAVEKDFKEGAWQWTSSFDVHELTHGLFCHSLLGRTIKGSGFSKLHMRLPGELTGLGWAAPGEAPGWWWLELEWEWESAPRRRTLELRTE